MLIEIIGGGFSKKGAELMLRTCVDRVRRELADARVCIEPRPDSDFRERAEMGLEHLFPSPALYPRPIARVVRRFTAANAASRAAGLLLPKRASQLYGVTPMGRADALLDIQGYAYGDKFHFAKPMLSAQRAGWYHKRGKPVILLPQMLGPFKIPKVAHATRKLAAMADLIYARDARSYELIAELLGETTKLRRAPDITIFAPSATETPANLPDEPFACMVPNARMLDKGGPDWSDIYMDRMRAVIRRVAERGLHPLVVVHERAGQDEKMARQLIDDCGAGTLYTEGSSQLLKAAIARSSMLIGSRFHSIVAALSTGVPVAVLGWAHKYPALLEDFGVPELIHNANDGEPALLAMIDRFCDDRERHAIGETLANAKRGMAEQNEAMWAEVFDLVRRANT